MFEDIDFKVKVTRAELENLCADLLDRVQGPIQAALEAAGMKVVRQDDLFRWQSYAHDAKYIG